MPVGISPPPLSEAFDNHAARLPTVDLREKLSLLKILYGHHRQYTFEMNFVSEAGFRAASGVSIDEFHRFRAAWQAYADYCRRLGAASGRILRRKHAEATKSVKGVKATKARKRRAVESLVRSELSETTEWSSVFLKKSYMLGTISALSGLSSDQVDRLLKHFAVDLSVDPPLYQHAGDGFLPPLFLFPNSVMFSPELVLRMMASRNIFYGLNRTDKDRFNNVVSHHLEPELIKTTMDLLQGFPEIEVVPNHRWHSGEVDLLVYHQAENAAIHFQVKAPLPPQGARMVKAVEDRILEGIGQINSLKAQGQEVVDRVVSSAIGRRVEGVRLVDAVLTRSSFGTERVWGQLDSVIAVNLAILVS